MKNRKSLTLVAAAIASCALVLAPVAEAQAAYTNAIHGVVASGGGGPVTYATERWHNTGGASFNITHVPPCGGTLYLYWRNAQTYVKITQAATWGNAGSRTLKTVAGSTSIPQQWFKIVSEESGQCGADNYFDGTVTF